VRINWENAHATQYLLQVSDDNSNWTTIKTVDNSQGGVEDITGLNGQGRYLRMQGVKRSSNYGYSIFEIQAFTGTPADHAAAGDPADHDQSGPGRPEQARRGIKPVARPPPRSRIPACRRNDRRQDQHPLGQFAEDGAWIQFDFGVKTQVGYMKLLWENSYGKEYALRTTSDDGKTWTQLRYVTNGQGGTEEFFNLNANARYIRLQGVARATNYGYSLFEVEFKTPGSDNTMASATTSPLKFPASGAGWAPLPAAANPIETLQFTLPDGTLVTRFGARGLARHGRERGEEWNEIGYGPNETVDPVTGLPADKGPGNYLTFVPQYFKNRTWGVEIIDNSRVAGVTKPSLIVNQYTTVDFLSGGIAFFRAIDRPGVTGYGWMNRRASWSTTASRSASRPPIRPTASWPAPTASTAPARWWSRTTPAMTALDANGFPNGQNIKARPLVVGDVVEVSPSMFTTVESLAAKATTAASATTLTSGPTWSARACAHGTARSRA
jgi:hypothetical protein